MREVFCNCKDPLVVLTQRLHNGQESTPRKATGMRTFLALHHVASKPIIQNSLQYEIISPSQAILDAKHDIATLAIVRTSLRLSLESSNKPYNSKQTQQTQKTCSNTTRPPPSTSRLQALRPPQAAEWEPSLQPGMATFQERTSNW